MRTLCRPVLVASAVLASTLIATPASADESTGELPGTGELSAMAQARPSTIAEAEQQFTDRTPAQFREQGLTWAPCPAESFPAIEQEAALAAGLECATVLAPRDWNAPAGGETIEVAISRVPQPAGRPERTVLSNPGGPGVAGLSLPATYGTQPAFAATEFIGIDTRGSGASTPLTCAADLPQIYVDLPDPRDRSAGALAQVEDAMSGVAANCAADPYAEFVTTEQIVGDLDLVRHLLGRETVDYYGASGGTWTGAQYATYFPARVGRFVLDSIMDVTGSHQDSFGLQPMGIDRRFRGDFANWVAQNSWAFHLGNTPEEVVASYEQLRANLAARPLDLDGSQMDGFALDGAVTGAMYDSTGFEGLAWTMVYLRAAHAAAVVGDLVGLEEFTRRAAEQQPAPATDPFDGRMLSSFHAITCNDTTTTRGAEFWNARGEELGPQYPVRGWMETWEPCAYWERPELTLPQPDGRDLPPVLHLQGLTDGMTPVEGARNTAAALPGTLITTADGDHGVFGAGNACVDDVVAEFIATGTLPATSEVTCPGVPIPPVGSTLLGS